MKPMNVLDLAQQKVPMKKLGNRYIGPWPSCGGHEKADRFHVFPDKNQGEGSYKCWGCDLGGDAIQFLRDFDRCSFREACARLGKEITRPDPYRTPAPAKQASSPTAPWTPPDLAPLPSCPWRDKAAALTDWAHNNLMRTQKKPVPGAVECKTWLQARGINEFTIRHFRLGWNPGKDGKDLFRHRDQWDLPAEIKDNGQPKRLWIPKGLIIPLRFEDQIIRIRIRRQADDPRYYVLPGSDMRCLTCQPPPPARAFVVVESELDAIMLDNEISDMAGIIALGSSSRKPDPAIWDMLEAAAVVLLALDYDTAGKKALEWWQHHLPQGKVWPVPEGKDPGEAYQAGVDIREWIKSGLPKGWFL